MAEFNFLTNLPQILIGIPRESFYTCLSIPLCFFFTIKSFYSLKYSRTGFSASPGFNKTEKYRICLYYFSLFVAELLANKLSLRQIPTLNARIQIFLILYMLDSLLLSIPPSLCIVQPEKRFSLQPLAVLTLA